MTVTPGSTIEKGTFNGEVINNGTITGGVFNNTVSGSGTIKGGTFTPPMTGSGTESDPYQIGTADQLKRFRDIVNGSNGQTQNRGACAVLMNDIVLNDGTFDANGTYTPGSSGTNPEEWTPIGKYTNDSNKTPYTGTFDGKHYAIKGLYVVNLPDLVVGLFGCLEGAAVRNLTVDGYVQGCHVVSGIAGDASANSTIENCRNNCRVVSEFVTGRSSSYLYVGGIVGLAKDTTIVGCVNTGVVEARGSYNDSRASKAAGIVCTLYGTASVSIWPQRVRPCRRSRPRPATNIPTIGVRGHRMATAPTAATAPATLWRQKTAPAGRRPAPPRLSARSVVRNTASLMRRTTPT